MCTHSGADFIVCVRFSMYTGEAGHTPSGSENEFA